MTLQENLELDVVQLICCSWATNFENKSEFVRYLRDVCYKRCTYIPSHYFTGGLITDGRLFAHVVEGPSAEVRKLHSKILSDQRNNRVQTLQHTLVHVRLFGPWPLAFLRVDALPHVAALNAQSTPVERRKASISILRAFRPVLIE